MRITMVIFLFILSFDVVGQIDLSTQQMFDKSPLQPLANEDFLILGEDTENGLNGNLVAYRTNKNLDILWKTNFDQVPRLSPAVDYVIQNHKIIYYSLNGRKKEINLADGKLTDLENWSSAEMLESHYITDSIHYFFSPKVLKKAIKNGGVLNYSSLNIYSGKFHKSSVNIEPIKGSVANNWIDRLQYQDFLVVQNHVILLITNKASELYMIDVDLEIAQASIKRIDAPREGRRIMSFTHDKNYLAFIIGTFNFKDEVIEKPTIVTYSFKSKETKERTVQSHERYYTNSRLFINDNTLEVWANSITERVRSNRDKLLGQSPGMASGEKPVSFMMSKAPIESTEDIILEKIKPFENEFENGYFLEKINLKNGNSILLYEEILDSIGNVGYARRIISISGNLHYFLLNAESEIIRTGTISKTYFTQRGMADSERPKWGFQGTGHFKTSPRYAAEASEDLQDNIVRPIYPYYASFETHELNIREVNNSVSIIAPVLNWDFELRVMHFIINGETGDLKSFASTQTWTSDDRFYLDYGFGNEDFIYCGQQASGGRIDMMKIPVQEIKVGK